MDKTLKILADFTGISPEVLKNAIEKDDPKEIKFDGLKIYKETDVETIKGNSKRDGIAEGKSSFVVDISKAAGIEGTFNNISDVLGAVRKNTLADAKIEPDKKVEELTGQLATAQKTISDKDIEIGNVNKSIESIKLSSKIAGKLPLKLANGLSREDGVLLLNSGLETVIENGEYFPTKNGQKIQDDKGNFISLNDHLESQIKAKGWDVAIEDQGKGGKGGGNITDPNPGKISNVSDIKSMSNFVEYCESENINQNSAKASQILTKAMTDNKDFSQK